ncbi:MAG TPA: TolC family protein, partial [Ferruginibacter sp.]|nr:TolC family protein [Ferruginibacter sp.]
MNRIKLFILTGMVSSALIYSGCKTPALTQSPTIQTLPTSFTVAGSDTTQNSGMQPWHSFFKDPYLVQLIDTALLHNQELAIAWQEIAIAKNDIRLRNGNLFPKVEAGAGIGIEKVGRYTSQGAGDASTDITPDREVPEWLPDYRLGVVASWEADIWKKLRNSKQAAVKRYLSSVEGRNFIITNLIAELANGYYELLALDNQLRIVKQSIVLQQQALNIVRIQKQAAAATELAVKKFEAEVLNAQTMEYDIQQKIKVKEYELNYLSGRFPQPIARDTNALLNLQPESLSVGLPAALLQNRPDIHQAELEVAAAKLDVKVARAEFFPS